MFANHLTLLRKSIANIYEKEITYRYLKQRAQFTKEQYFRTYPSRPLTAMRTKRPVRCVPKRIREQMDARVASLRSKEAVLPLTRGLVWPLLLRNRYHPPSPHSLLSLTLSLRGRISLADLPAPKSLPPPSEKLYVANNGACWLYWRRWGKSAALLYALYTCARTQNTGGGRRVRRVHMYSTVQFTMYMQYTHPTRPIRGGGEGGVKLFFYSFHDFTSK